MAKIKTVFICNECGNETTKWMGQCLSCKGWNTFIEEIKANSAVIPKKVSGQLQYKEVKPTKLKDIKSHGTMRMATGINELDRVLGGGIVEGSLILVGGDPGIGKSTLMLQICQSLGDNDKKILYISGEESLHQIKMRGERLGVSTDKMLLYTQTNTDIIEKVIIHENPDILMIDSIQTMYSDAITSVPGSVSQVREVTAHLMRLAKQLNIATFIVGLFIKNQIKLNMICL